MTKEQYVEIINRATQNLLDSTEDYKKLYNSEVHGTKSGYIKIKETKSNDPYKTGLNVINDNVSTDGKLKPYFEEEKVVQEKTEYEYEVPNPDYDKENNPNVPETIKKTGTEVTEVKKKELDTDAIARVSNTGMALTIAYEMAVEIGIIRDYYDKKIAELWDEAKRLQKEIDNLRSDTNGANKTTNSEIEKLKSRVSSIETKIK